MDIGKDGGNGNNDGKVYDEDDVDNIWDDGTTIQDFYGLWWCQFEPLRVCWKQWISENTIHSRVMKLLS